MSSNANAIESVLNENRLFDPPSAEAVGAPYWHISSMEQYRAMHERSVNDPEGFWGEVARELHWFSPWRKVVEFEAPDAKWFVGGKTNLCYNCVDRHVEAGHGDEVAIIWEGEPFLTTGKPEIRTLTYADLKRETSRFGNVLKKMGVKKGDVVTIYMGMVPELAIAVLACARIGAAHSVIFGGFSAQAIADRVADARSKVIVTCDGAWRRGKVVPLKENVDSAVNELSGSSAMGAAGMTRDKIVEKVIYFKRTMNQIVWHQDRDFAWRDLMVMADDECPCEPLDAEDTSFLLYTSGSTGKPKGIRHTVGGYMAHTYLTSKHTFNLIPGLSEPKRARPLPDGQVFWCTADVGWITGHSYILYGVLANRVPSLMFEGAPNFPAEDRFWDIGAFMKWGDEHVKKHDLSSLQVLGTVGEPINPEAWMWYREHIGRNLLPIVDTWWQTETGGHMLTPLPGVTPTKPGSCTLPFFGVDAAIVDEEGKELPNGSGGLLAIRKPWPGMLRGVFGDRNRFIETYWKKFDVDGCLDPNRTGGAKPSPFYFPGDGARRDEHGYFWIMGRVDDVINVSGHRLGTMEVESALVSHPAVVEAAVVGMPHEIKGTGIAAFCTLEPHHAPKNKEETERLKASLGAHVAKEIGAIARPDLIRFTDALPKTRSGKIMRRLLRDVAAGKTSTQDTTTLEDFSVLARLREASE
jgi:acetyl-CoA synthetase